ncbi:uncharacterized protein LOC125418365 [Ziziphus jujuba]|uniref:Uncharacterized protein LOC125418365 n=1 Tax=Ziziphus jujuba TaxID=326968 RepID=A0A6P4ACM5_ZIZJJ|nr:uncharacterized protein LOC125418365 [Ziziphus jujuba]
MSAIWFALKKSLLCKPQLSDVYDPNLSGNLHNVDSASSIAERSTCSRCISNSKYVIWRSKRHIENPSRCSAKITPKSCVMKAQKSNTEGNQVPSNISGAGASEPEGYQMVSSSFEFQIPAELLRKWDEQYKDLDAVEADHVSRHAVTELGEEDSSRRIVEIICQTGCIESETNTKEQRIERILKVQNMQKILDWFEEYREVVKMKARTEPDKNPRCLVDGNELLRFYGTTISCSIGMNGSYGPCTSDSCGACRILRDGFSTNKNLHGWLGIFTLSTSQNALKYIEHNGEGKSLRKALFVCRVIAGRVHRPQEKVQEFTGSEFESLAWKLEPHSNVEELYVLNPRALLPCFMVIFKH